MNRPAAPSMLPALLAALPGFLLSPVPLTGLAAVLATLALTPRPAPTTPTPQVLTAGPPAAAPVDPATARLDAYGFPTYPPSTVVDTGMTGTRCRVSAFYRPVGWPWFIPHDKQLRRIVVELMPGCPYNGFAVVRFHSQLTGRSQPERGGYVLDNWHSRVAFPPVFRSGVLPDWGPYWVAISGAEYRVRQTPRPPAPAAR